MKYEHIDTLCDQFGVPLAVIQKYNREHRDEIENIKDIFTLKGDYKEKYLALLYMFSSDKEENVIRQYREQTGLNKAEQDPSQLIEQYKVLLLTALIYNQDFYAMVINSIGFASAGLKAGETEKDSFTPIGKIINFPVNRSRFSRSTKRKIAIAAAASFVFIFFIGSVGALDKNNKIGDIVISILFRTFNIGHGPQINNALASILKEPQKDDDGIAYVSMGDMRIDILSPFDPRAKGATRGPEDDTGDIQATISYYNKAIRGDKNNASLYIERGIAYTFDGYIEAAIKDFNKAIEFEPQNASAYYNRAIANAGRNAEIDTIAADFKTTIAINPDDKDAYYAIGVLYYRQYEKDKAIGLLDTAIDAFKHIKGYKDADKFLVYLNEIRKP